MSAVKHNPLIPDQSVVVSPSVRGMPAPSGTARALAGSFPGQGSWQVQGRVLGRGGVARPRPFPALNHKTCPCAERRTRDLTE
jgi:hypothetical protein